MSKEDQAKLRIAVPGTMILLFILLLIIPLFVLRYDLTLDSIVSSLGTLGAIVSLIVSVIVVRLVIPVLGSLYQIARLRKRLLKESQRRIDDNIKRRILSLYATNPTIAHNADWLSQGRCLLNVFYDFIDNKPSLKERAKGVYLNGLFWSSAADLTTISSISAILGLSIYLLNQGDYYLVLCGSCLLIGLLSWLLIPILARRHIELGNEQIDFIQDIHGTDLQSRLVTLVKSRER
jgi:hypothetical protein